MITFLTWLVLFVLCWPLALFALLLYPIVWVLLLPFRLVGLAVNGWTAKGSPYSTDATRSPSKVNGSVCPNRSTKTRPSGLRGLNAMSR